MTRRANLIFVDVDTQFDFCDERGTLRVPGAPNDVFRRLTTFAVAERIPIVGSVDSHAWDAWEFASSERAGPGGERPGFPDHCVKGTAGWLKVAGTLPPRFRFVPNVPEMAVEVPDEVRSRGFEPWVAELVGRKMHAVYFEKEVYSFFANPLAEPFLARLVESLSDDGAPEFVVYGVATDYCVKAAALGLRQRGYACRLLLDGVAGITPAGSQAAVDEMKRAGVQLGRAAELVG